MSYDYNSRKKDESDEIQPDLSLKPPKMQTKSVSCPFFKVIYVSKV
jgi:hypothetical protein